MPSAPNPPGKPKPKLPAPSFQYGSNTYMTLSYAKMIRKPFDIPAVRSFNFKYQNDYEVRRSLHVLVKNGSLQKLEDDKWIITPLGVQHIFDFAARRQVAFLQN
jgi:hypothetical protein